MKQPCAKDCPRRKERCFQSCPEWKQYEAERKERWRIKERDYSANQYLNKSEQKNLWAYSRKKTGR